MTHFLIELIFVGSIVGMLLLLAALQSIARYNSSKKIKNPGILSQPSPPQSGAKIIQLSKNTGKAADRRFLVKDNYSEEEIV
jgi:hypothetical protein